jgi:hypothetical protein
MAGGSEPPKEGQGLDRRIGILLSILRVPPLRDASG